MKLVSIVLLLIAAILSCQVSSNIIKNRAQGSGISSKRFTKGIPLKGKQIPYQQTHTKVDKSKTKASNAKRWMPIKKNDVKYTPKIANNTKRWMPGFAEMGQNDMESSMMFDSGFVSSDQASNFQGGEAQPQNVFGVPQQETSQQNLPPEQSYLTPGTNDLGLQGQAPVSRSQENQFQGYGNEIESFTKEGLENGVSSMFNNFDGFSENGFNNPKYQEGDFIGATMPENTDGKQANLFDSFPLEPGMAENFVNPPKEKGNGDSKPEDEDKKAKDKNEKDDKNSKEENKEKTEKQDEKDKDSGKGKSSDESKKEKGKGKDEAKAVSGSQKEEVKNENGKEANEIDESDKEAKQKGKEKDDNSKEENNSAGKEKNETDTESAAENEKNNNKNEKETAKNKDKTQGKEKAAANLVEDDNEAETKGEEQGQNGKSEEHSKEAEEKTGDAEKTDSKIHKGNKKGKKLQKQVKVAEKPGVKAAAENQDDSDSEKAEVQQEAVREDKDSRNENQPEKQNSKNEQQEVQTESNEKEQSKIVPKEEDENRIKKLKQRINKQKMIKSHGRLQQDAAERHKISSDSDNLVTENALVNNISPVNGALGLAAEGLRNKLVSNLRHELMKNMAAAMAKGRNVNSLSNGAGQGPRGKQAMKPEEESRGSSGMMKQESQQAAEQQENNNEQRNYQKAGNKGEQAAEAGAQATGNQAEGGSSGSDQSLVPTLMKMDKTMLVDTIIKLLKKNKEANKSNGEKQMTDKSDSSESDGTINQSFHNQQVAAPEGPKSDDGTGQMAAQRLDIKEAASTEGANEAKEDSDKKEEENNNDNNNQKADSAVKEEDNGHSEYATVPIKSQGETKFYKFKKLQGQGHIKGKLGRFNGVDDPYSQIGLVDPANNDKMPVHHKASSLKEDLEKQQEKISKFIGNKGQQSEQSAQPINQDTDNAMEQNQNQATNQESTNNQNQETAQPINQEQKQSSSNQRSDQGSNNNQEADQPAEASPDQSTEGNQEQQSDNQSDQVNNQESTNTQKSDQDAQIQQSLVQQQPDGATTVTNINADSPKMVAQLLKISQRLHDLNNKKATQNQQKVNSDQSKTITNNYSDAGVPQKSRDDAYATIGSLDPNVKKKAAIGKKKGMIINKQLTNKDLMNNENMISKRRLQ